MIDGTKLSDLFRRDQRKGQGLFPELIKKLVIASANSNIVYLRFPSGDEIWAPGFDGIVTGIINGGQFLPSGNSVWEFGTGNKFKIKIDSDYKKRTEEAVFFEKSDYSFILCTPFIFDGNLLSLQASFQNDRIWKDVFIYDAEIIANWLNEYPETIVWLYEQFESNYNHLKISTAKNTLTSYLNITNPKLTHELILSSQNNNEGNQIAQFESNLIAQSRGVFMLFSPISIEHGVLFSLAVLSENQALFEKTLVVENTESLEFVEKELASQIVLINFWWNGLGLKLHNNRYIYIITDEGVNVMQKLNNIRFEDFSNNLEKMGFEPGEAHRVTERTNRNISCLKRMYATDPLLKTPTWSQDRQRAQIIPLALVSEINTRFDGDLEIVNQLYGESNYISVL